MKYCVKNKLDLFEFHDAEFNFVRFDKNELILSTKHLNIHENANENPHGCDMEIDLAEFVFTGFEVISFEPMQTYQIDDDGNWHTNETQIIYNGEEAEKHFLNEIKNGFTVNCIDICEKENKTYIELSTSFQACFFATFAFNEVIVKWDEYLKKAWYELHKQYIHKGYLITPTGEEETEIHIVHHEEDTYYQGKLEKAPNVSVGVTYAGEQLWGQGKDYLWIDAFADLQKKLPEGVILKCCMTCRHGNMCPYGNKTGEIFCTKDITINDKMDICNLFDGWTVDSDIEKRLRKVTDSCADYQAQSDDFFTYNDYLYYLNK